MSRCKSWRFVAAPDNADRYLPVGKDHRVWRPCHNKLPAGQARCRDCQDALITCPSAVIRRALASEKGQDPYVLESLVSDNDATVSAAAERQLTNQKGIWTNNDIPELTR